MCSFKLLLHMLSSHQQYTAMFCTLKIVTSVVPINYIWLSATRSFLFNVSCLKIWLNLCFLIICSLPSLEILAPFCKSNDYYKILMVKLLVRQSGSGFRLIDIWSYHTGGFLLLKSEDFGNQEKPLESYSTWKMYFWVIVIKTYSGKKIISCCCLPSS